MKVKIKFAVCCVLLVFLNAPGVRSYLTVLPINTAAVASDQAILNCGSSLGSESIAWSTGSNELVKYCQVNPGFASQVTIQNTTNQTCNLVLLNVTQANADYFTCTDGDFTSPSIWSAYLTVLESEPVCQLNATAYLTPGELVSMPCEVGYTSPNVGMTASMDWTCTTCAPSMTYSTQGKTQYASSSACVVAEPLTLSSCTCTTYFNAPTNAPDAYSTNAPTYSYTWSSPSNVNVSYCPNVSISSPNDPVNVFQYTSFTCTVDAYPPVASVVISSTTGSGFQTGNSFNLTSIGNYSISCTATNYLLGGTNDPCSTTTTVTGTSYQSYCPESVTIIASSVNVTAGDTLTCTADSNPPVSTYQWTGVSDGVTVSYTGQSYVLLSGGSYNISCTATNYLYDDQSTPCSASTEISGIAEYCPEDVLISDSTSAVVVAGDTLICSAEAYPAVISYQWTGDVNGNSFSSSGSTFIVPSGGAYNISCTTTNYLNDNTSPCSATTYISGNAEYCPMNVTISDSNAVVVAGDTLTCDASSYPAVTMYQWSGEVNGVNISSSGSTFVLPSGGVYNISCTTTNYVNNGSTPCSATTYISGFAEYCPENVAISDSTSAVLVAGDTLTCTADADPPVTVFQWTGEVNGVSISSSGSTFVLPSGGEYNITCTTKNYLDNNATSCSASTTIIGTAEYCPENVTISDSTSVVVVAGNTLTCTADADPPVTVFQWTGVVNGVSISSSGSTLVVPSGGAYNISCTATNYVNNGSTPCSAITFISGFAESTTIEPTTTTEASTAVSTSASQAASSELTTTTAASTVTTSPASSSPTSSVLSTTTTSPVFTSEATGTTTQPASTTVSPASQAASSEPTTTTVASTVTTSPAASNVPTTTEASTTTTSSASSAPTTTMASTTTTTPPASNALLTTAPSTTTTSPGVVVKLFNKVDNAVNKVVDTAVKAVEKKVEFTKTELSKLFHRVF